MSNQKYTPPQSPQMKAYLKLNITAIAKRVADFVMRNPGCNRNDICKGLGLRSHSASGRIADAQRFGLISKIDESKDGQVCYIYEPDLKRRAFLADQWYSQRKVKRVKGLVSDFPDMPLNIQRELTAWSRQQRLAI